MTRRLVAVVLLAAAVAGLFVGMALGVLEANPPQTTSAAGVNAPAADDGTDTPTPTPTPTEVAGPARDQTYVVTNKLTRLAADVFNEEDEDGTPVQLFEPHGRSNQQWRIQDADDGFVTLVSVDSGKCLQIEDSSEQPEATAEIDDCSRDDAQLWRFEENQDGWALTSKNSGLVLDASDDEGDSRDVLQRPGDGSQRSQVWFFTPLG